MVTVQHTAPLQPLNTLQSQAVPVAHDGRWSGSIQERLDGVLTFGSVAVLVI